MTNEERQQAVEWLKRRPVMMAGAKRMYDLAIEALEQPEIIRCKDCRYARMTTDGDCKYCDIWFPYDAEYMPGDYYCGSAEKRGEAE